MISFPDYKTATNEAYRIIAERDCFSIETDVFAIAGQLKNCRVHSYGSASFIYGISTDILLDTSEFGFSIKKNGKRIIYYNENLSYPCIRFTIAHEIAHAVLDHQDEDDAVAEKEANCFARNLLCPLPVARAFEAETENDYVSLFNVSDTMAHVTISRRTSDAYYLYDKYRAIIEGKIYAYNMGYDTLDAFMRYTYA